MDEERFWSLVDDAAAREARGGGPPVAATALVGVLVERLTPDEVVRFSRRADVVADRAATPDLLAACHLVDGWHSDDAFRDFRDLLVLAGRAVLERAVENADSLAEHPAIVRARRDGRLAPGPVDDLARAAWAALTGDGDEDDWFDAVSAAGPEDGAGAGDRPRGVPWSAWSRDQYAARLPALTSLLGDPRDHRGR